MSLFTTFFLAVIVGLPIFMWWKMGGRHGDGFGAVTMGFMVVISLLMFSTMYPIMDGIVVNGTYDIYGSATPEAVTLHLVDNETGTTNATGTNTDIMGMLNKTPENTSKYWNNDWVRDKT